MAREEEQEMACEDKDELWELLNSLKEISYVKPEDLPNIDLYMDQVTTFMDRHLASTKRRNEDKLLTKTMINNYTKNNLLPSPEKKKYSKDHMYLLILIYYLKNVFSITDIQSVLEPLNDRYFGGAGEVSMEQIYKEIFEIQKTQAEAAAKDVTRKWTAVENSFEELASEEQKMFLRKLSMICLLSFDVYMKRQLIEHIIDTEFAPKQAEVQKSKEEKNSKQKKDKSEKNDKSDKNDKNEKENKDK